MLNLTRLLCGTHTEGDGLRYGEQVSSLPNAIKPQTSIHRRPIVVWNVTRRCNLHCMHCYTDSHDRDYPGELTSAEARSLVEDLAEYGVPVLLFSGGEPLTRPDLMDLVRMAVRRGMRTVISTNGTLIDRETVKDLANAGVSYVGISLDGLEATHDKMRGKKGAFQESIRGIRLCKEAGIKVGVRFTLNRRNQADLGGLLDLVEQEDIPRVCVYHLVYSGRGATDTVRKLDLAPDERREAVALIFNRTLDFHRRGLSKEVLTVDNHADAGYLMMWVRQHLPDRLEEVQTLLRRNRGNSSGIGIGCVDEQGNVHPDQFWRNFSMGNVRERPFSKIWEDTSDPAVAGLKDRKALLPERCNACKFLNICNGNMRVRAEAATGDIWGFDPACYLTDEEIGLRDKVAVA